MDNRRRTSAPFPPGDAPGRWLPAVLVLALWTGWAIWVHAGQWPEDLSAVYVGAHLWQSGQHALIYATPPQFYGGAAESWTPVMADLGVAGRPTFPYVYPPLWAALLAPVTAHVGVQGFLAAFSTAQVGLMAASVLLADRLFRPPGMTHLLWALLSVVMLSTMVQPYATLWHSQPTILTTFLTLLAFVAIREGRPVAAGVALAVAAAIKLTPAAFAVLFLFDRQYRALAAFLIMGAALALASLLVAGIDLHRDFLASLGRIRTAWLLVPVNVSLRPALLALGSVLGLYPAIDPGVPATILSPVPPVLSALVTLAGAAIAGACLLALRGAPQERRLPLALMVLGIVIPVFGPLGWLHYYMLPLFLLPGIPGLFRPARALLLAAIIVVPSLEPVFAKITLLPWPTADFVWISLAGWLGLLAALCHAARRAA